MFFIIQCSSPRAAAVRKPPIADLLAVTSEPLQRLPLKDADLQFSDPCKKASKASLQCLEQTHYNKGEVSCGSM